MKATTIGCRKSTCPSCPKRQAPRLKPKFAKPNIIKIATAALPIGPPALGIQEAKSDQHRAPRHAASEVEEAEKGDGVRPTVTQFTFEGNPSAIQCHLRFYGRDVIRARANVHYQLRFQAWTRYLGKAAQRILGGNDAERKFEIPAAGKDGAWPN
jgi:hypothetical protein